MKIYRGTRYGQHQLTVTVEQSTPRKPPGPQIALRHLVRHSPTGFQWGYGGSGPSDLARSLLADLFGEPEIHQTLYRAFTGAIIRNLGDTWTLTEEQVRGVVRGILIDEAVDRDACVRCFDRGLCGLSGYCHCPKGVALEQIENVAGGIDDHLLGEGRN